MRYFSVLAMVSVGYPAFAFQAADPHAILARMFEVTGFSKNSDKILRWRDIQGVEQNYQSAPPYVTVAYSRECWIDLKSGAERVSSQMVFPGGGEIAPVLTLLSRRAVYSLRDGKAAPAPGSPGQRNLDLWAVLTDWRDAPDVRRARDEAYQGFSRTVLARKGEFGEERLFIETNSGLPLKLDREEPHYMWGQVHVEFTWAIWQRRGTALAPTAAARVVDGFKEITRTVKDFELVNREQAPDFPVPVEESPANPIPLYLQPLPPKRVDVSPHLFLSVNAGYTEAFALIGNTVYVLDATQGEARARQDLKLMREAFPGAHDVAVIISDTAWPHIAGLRFWVSQGATVLSHRTSREMLARAVERRWTRAPDLLEQRRGRASFNFVPIDDHLAREGRKLLLKAVEGTENDGAVMAFLPDEHFLWACDCIQDVSRPATGTEEVWRSVRAMGISPSQVAAMHIPLTPWSTIERLVRGVSPIPPH